MGLNIQLKNVSVRNGANVLSLAVIDGKVIIIGEQQIVSFSKDMNITLEEVSKKMIELENEDKERYTFKEHDTKKVVLPKTSVKIRSESWTRDIAKTTLKSYLRIFNLGKNSKLRFGDACNEPAGWPPSLSFADFKGVSYATKENLTKIVESLIRHHMDVDPVTYYDSAVRRDDLESSDEDSDQDLVRNNGNPEVIDNQQQQVGQNMHQGNNFESAPLTLDPRGKWYWDFQEQQWFPVTLDPTEGYYWNYPHQFWSVYNLSQNDQS